MKSICNNARLFRSHDSEKGLPTDPMLPCPSPHRQVAAALSAVVTTTKQHGTAPNSHGRTSPKEASSLFPAALRERGVWGRGASLREAASPPASFSPVSSEGSAREGASLQRSLLPRIFFRLSFFRTKFLKSCERYGIFKGSVV